MHEAVYGSGLAKEERSAGVEGAAWREFCISMHVVAIPMSHIGVGAYNMAREYTQII